MYEAKIYSLVLLTSSYVCTVACSSYYYIIILQINGRKVMRIPARDAYAFALQLMDTLFTKEEMSKSLLYKSDNIKRG